MMLLADNFHVLSDKIIIKSVCITASDPDQGALNCYLNVVFLLYKPDFFPQEQTKLSETNSQLQDKLKVFQVNTMM